MAINEIVRRGANLVQAGADEDITDALRSSCERNLYVFSKLICGMNAFTSHLHLPLCNRLQGALREQVLLTPRGTFKTSMARCLGMHLYIQPATHNVYFPGRSGTNIRQLYAAENERRAVSRIGWIRRQFLNNELLRELWPEAVYRNPEAESPIWTLNHFQPGPRTEDAPEAAFESCGVDSGSTGGHYDVIIKDDLIGSRSRKQPQLMVAAIEWWKTSHSLRNDPEKSRDYVFGTRWAAEDLYSWIMEFEPHYDIKILSCYKGDGKPLFPERLPRELLEKFKLAYGEMYYLNYENRAVGAGTTAFNMDFCGKFQLDGDTITFSADDKTVKILELIENGNKPAEAKPRIKPFWKQTPEERSETWLTMQRNWQRDRLSRLDVS